MRPIPLALALVALAHVVYVPGELSPVTFSTLFNAATSVLLGIAAWDFARGGAPRVALLSLVALGAVKLVDFATSFSGGFQTYHWGWLLIVAGATLLAVAALQWRRALPEAPAARVRLLRIGAGLQAAGSLVYVVLALFGGPLAFLVGAAAATLGWGLLATTSDLAPAEPMATPATP